MSEEPMHSIDGRHTIEAGIDQYGQVCRLAPC